MSNTGQVWPARPARCFTLSADCSLATFAKQPLSTSYGSVNIWYHMPIRPPHDKLLEFLAPYRREITQLALRTREAILKQDPKAIELLYDAYNAVVTAFSLTDRLKGAFCAVAVYRDYVNLGFNYGALLPDPKRRLLGKGVRIRHIRIESPGELNAPEVVELIRQAAFRVPRAAGSKETGRAIVKAIYPKKRRPAPEH
jgi:hypothetical protein